MVLLLMAVSTLQQTFDAGDRRRALAGLQNTFPRQGGPSLEETLRTRGVGHPPRCVAEVVSGFRGISRVTCTLEGDPVPYRFLWDDVRRDALRPEDDATRQRLGGG
ncbi:MAG: hypothetical protein HZB56_19685 [Deltaproteobacteria bacterium]|nr:hypothetical protein [Deltaproteobacteria bacterium]